MSNFIFLDVDGVLNTYNSNEESRKVTGHSVSVGIPDGTGRAFTMHLRPEDGPALVATGAQIVWATTWVGCDHQALEDIAAHVGLPTGLPRISHVTPWERRGPTCGKLEAINLFLIDQPEIHRVCWIDDDLNFDDINFLNALSKDGVRTSWFRPEPREGLTFLLPDIDSFFRED